MSLLAVIGGSGFYDFPELLDREVLRVETQYSSVNLVKGRLNDTPLVFLNRHSDGHKMPPHKIQYRANISALHQLGVTDIFATNAVGGIAENVPPSTLVIPDQLIDYTWGRESTFFDSFDESMTHIDFTFPFSKPLRENLLNAASKINEPVLDGGVYACTQGPRLETAAEIQRLKGDGNTVVGMTAMPEAALARELNINYASVCFCVNWGAGIGGEISLDDIFQNAESCIGKIQRLLTAAITEA